MVTARVGGDADVDVNVVKHTVGCWCMLCGALDDVFPSFCGCSGCLSIEPFSEFIMSSVLFVQNNLRGRINIS